MADANIHPPDRAVKLQTSYIELVRRKRPYSGLMMAVSVTLFASAFLVAEDRNADGYLDGIGNVFDFPSEVVSEVIEKSANLLGHLVTYIPALLETLNIAAVSTIVGVIVGTFGAAMIALPLAFLVARNFTPLMSVRFFFRRVFDFVRGVDALIWTIVQARAFGPGLMTGALAIQFTDTGSFGKIFSEALENVDDKQIEGVRSTGVRPIQRHRFGVLPQVMPVLLS